MSHNESDQVDLSTSFSGREKRWLDENLPCLGEIQVGELPSRDHSSPNILLFK